MAAKITATAIGSSAQIDSTRFAPYRSLIQPITGPAMAVEKEPDAPTIASSSAPPRGNRSDVIPSIVGHQNATPPAKSAAAANAAAGVVALLKRNNPAAAANAVDAMSAVGGTRCAAPPRNCRIKYMMPFTHT